MTFGFMRNYMEYKGRTVFRNDAVFLPNYKGSDPRRSWSLSTVIGKADVDEKIKLKWFFKTWDGKAGAGFIWLKIVTGGQLL
jgi:hypothetical protein